MPSTVGWQTYQTVQNYEQALARHGQYVRWTRAIVCPCLNPVTNQPDLRCTLCSGRGRIYSTPGRFNVQWEIARHNNVGKVYPKNAGLIVGSAAVYRKSTALALASIQPSDGSYVQLDPPYPKEWERVFLNYTFSSDEEVSGENAQVVATNTLKVTGLLTQYRGRYYPGSIASVSLVYNETKAETYTVRKFEKDFIFLTGMGTWASGDVLSVNYVFVRPFNFVLSGVTPKMRYERPYILDEATSQLLTPYYCRVSPDDLITCLTSEHIGSAIIDPTMTVGNDVINNYYDIVKLNRIVDQSGTSYNVDSDVTLAGRNEIHWNVTKPTRRYTVQFFYNPTYIALKDFSSMRTAENKEFVNKINLMQYDMINAKRTF